MYADFIAHMLNLDSAKEIEVKFAHGSWRVAFPGAYNSRPEASAGFGSGAVRFSRLLEAAMSNLTLSITYHDPKKGVVRMRKDQGRQCGQGGDEVKVWRVVVERR